MRRCAGAGGWTGRTPRHHRCRPERGESRTGSGRVGHRRDAEPAHAIQAIVVTEDAGRFVVPDLPDGSYHVWVRGYGLRDSRPVEASRGDTVELLVSNAETPQHAAAIYPASYWLSLYRPPAANELPDEFDDRAQWIANMKLGCMRCHQFGGQVFHAHTRPESWENAWRHRSLEQRTARVARCGGVSANAGGVGDPHR